MANQFRYFLEDSAFAGTGAVTTPLALIAIVLIIIETLEHFGK